MKTTLIKELDRYTVYVDTCSIMNSYFIPLVNQCRNKMKQKGYALHTLSVVIDELYKISINSKQTPSDRKKAKTTLAFLGELSKEGLLIVDFYKTENHTKFADVHFLSYFISNCSSKPMAILSQDKNLLLDILQIKKLLSFNSININALKIMNNKLVSIN